jgi:hypothetical protein
MVCVVCNERYRVYWAGCPSKCYKCWLKEQDKFLEEMREEAKDFQIYYAQSHHISMPKEKSKC